MAECKIHRLFIFRGQNRHAHPSFIEQLNYTDKASRGERSWLKDDIAFIEGGLQHTFEE